MPVHAINDALASLEKLLFCSTNRKLSMRHNVPLSYRRQAVFHVRRPRVGVPKGKPPAALSYAKRVDFITGLPVYSLSGPSRRPVRA